MKHVEYLANGLGGPSVLLLVWACEGRIPATISITSDTGSETDRLLNTGERITAREYFDRIVEPLAREGGIEARFVRARDGNRTELPALIDVVRNRPQGKPLSSSLHIPLFGSNGGRLIQSCTDRWKIRAISQELRRLGARSARGAQGIHYGEAARRVKGEWLGVVDGFDTYRFGPKWLSHYYPFVDARLNRSAIAEELDRRGIPFLVTSECDMCPHQDLARWERHTPESTAGRVQRGARLYHRPGHRGEHLQRRDDLRACRRTGRDPASEHTRPRVVQAVRGDRRVDAGDARLRRENQRDCHVPYGARRTSAEGVRPDLSRSLNANLRAVAAGHDPEQGHR